MKAEYDIIDRSRTSAHNHRLFGLDHLRAFAISFVFVFHYGRLFPHPEWTNTVSQFGWTGVDLFFVLSGYLISAQLFAKIASNNKISFNEFFIKRFFRIIPAYLVIVALYFLFPSFREREATAPLWKYLTFTQNLGLDLRYQGTFSHAWSLCIEEQFYLFLPLILIVLVASKAIKKGGLILLFIFITVFLIRLYSYQTLVAPFADDDLFGIYWYRWIYYPTYCRLDGLLVGVSIAAALEFKPSLKTLLQKYKNYLLPASLLVLAAAYFLCSEPEGFNASIFGFTLVSIGYGLLLVNAINPGSFLYRFGSKITARLASLSYALYLCHKIIIHLTQEQFSKLHISKDGNVMFLLCIVTCLAAALLLNKTIEQPFLQLREKLIKKQQNKHYLNLV